MMIKRYIAIVLISCMSNVAQAQIQNMVSHTVFYEHGGGNYMESYLYTFGNSALWLRNADGSYTASVHYTQYFIQQGDTVYVKDFDVDSPTLPDSLAPLQDFIHLERTLLPPGKYMVSTECYDKLDSSRLRVHERSIIIAGYNAHQPALTDPVIIVSIEAEPGYQGRFVKYGMEIIPHPTNFIPERMRVLRFYCELYNTDTIDASLQFLYYIKPLYQDSILESSLKQAEMKSDNQAVALFGDIPISKLPSGNYELICAIMQDGDTLLKKTKMLMRSNPSYDFALLSKNSPDSMFVDKYKDVDSLREYVSSLRPIAVISEKRIIDRLAESDNAENMRRFLYGFWYRRYKGQARQEWEYYLQAVKAVNNTYGSSIIKGYDTDQGRVFLQYGMPQNIEKRPAEASAYPYEIWYYDMIDDDQFNKKFIFYNPSLIGNQYLLLHSDVRGELHNPDWEYHLNQRNTPYDRDMDNTNIRTGPGNNARILYDR